MKKTPKKILYFLVPPTILIIIWTSFSSGDHSAYIRSVSETIANRRQYLKSGDDSPFKQFGKTYHEPEYYPIDPKYRVNAAVERFQKRELVRVPNSKSDTQMYSKFARLHFNLLGREQELLVLKPYGMGSNSVLFCAFSDKTSGVSTYGGGRYLDVTIGKSNKTILDFNLAYNPYCAYTEEYACPLPPPENMLDVAVRAGEKDYPYMK